MSSLKKLHCIKYFIIFVSVPTGRCIFFRKNVSPTSYYVFMSNNERCSKNSKKIVCAECASMEDILCFYIIFQIDGNDRHFG